MGHARCLPNLTAHVQLCITGECVCLQYALEVGKVSLRVFATTIRCVGKPDRRCFGRTTGPVIANLHPKAAGLRPAIARREHRQRCIVGVNLGTAKCVAAHRVDQRGEQPVKRIRNLSHFARERAK